MNEQVECPKCEQANVAGSKFCRECGEKFPLEAIHVSPYGLWEVTTDGDIEGRTTQSLGLHQGFIDEIARHLSRNHARQLYFAPAKVIIHKDHNSTKSLKATIRLSFLPVENNDNIKKIVNFFSKRTCTVVQSQYHGCVDLIFPEKLTTR